MNGTANLHVFSNPLTGKHPYPDSFKKPLATACRRADVTVVTPHGLRHSAATIALAFGATERAVMDLLGQVDIRMVARYQHVMERLRVRTIAHINDAWPADGDVEEGAG